MGAFVIAITGTPGTGKSTVAKLLAKRTGWRCVDLNREIVRNGLYSGYDHKRRSYITDMRRVTIFIRKLVHGERPVIIEGHLSHNLPKEMVDKVFVLRCRTDVLRKRLERKRWPKAKIDENVEAEMIGLIAWEAKKKHAHVVELDITRLSPLTIAVKMEKSLKGRAGTHTAP